MRSFNCLTLIAVIALSGAYPALGASSATLQVGAHVLPFVSFNAVQHVSTYQVKGEDIKRGYIDLPASMTVSVRTNLREGVPVFFENTAGASVLIRESGRTDFNGHSFTLNTDDYRPNTPISKRYDFRVILSGDAKDGTYPLMISMAPSI